jgi:hypothetical protein
MASPVLAAAANVSGARVSSWASPAINPTDDEVLLLAIVGIANTDRTITTPSGWAKREEAVELNRYDHRLVYYERAVGAASGPYSDVFAADGICYWGIHQLAFKATGAQPDNQGSAHAWYANSSSTSRPLTANLDMAPTVGNVLIASLASDAWGPPYSVAEEDKHPVWPDGWISLPSTGAINGFGRVNSAYKVSDGTETGITAHYYSDHIAEQLLIVAEYAIESDPAPPPPPPPADATGWDVYAPGDPNGDIQVTLENAYARAWRDELNGAGKGGFTINRYADEVPYLLEGSIVKIRIPELGEDYVFGFELQDVDATLAAAAEKGSEELVFSGPGVFAYLDRAEMLNRAFTTGVDTSDTWTKEWQTGAVKNPVGAAFDAADPDYVWILGRTSRKIYKLRQSDRKVVSVSPALFSAAAGGLTLDPSDATIFWVLEAPWRSGSSANTKIHKVRRSDYAILDTHNLGSAIKHSDIQAGGTHLWLSRYDGTTLIYKRSKATGAVVDSYTIAFNGTNQTQATGISINGTALAYWFAGKKRALLATEAAPTTITGKIKTTGISSFGGEWTTEGGDDYFYMVSESVDQTWKYRLTTSTPTDPIDDVWRLDEGTAIAIAKRIIDEAQAPARPQQPIPDVTLDFTATTDSDGNPAEAIDGVLEFTANVGDKVGATILRLTPYGPVFRMSPDLVLSAYNSFGVDRSSATFAAGKVRLEKGVSIASDIQRKGRTKHLDTYMLAKGEGSVYAEAELVDQAYAREGFVSTSLTDSDALEGTAAAELDNERVLSESVALGVRWGDDELAGKYLPYVHYQPGDVARVHTGTTPRDFNEQDFEVYALQVDEGPADDWSATVELKSGFERKGMPGGGGGSGGASGGGTGTASSTQGGSTITVIDSSSGDVARGATIESDDFGVFQPRAGVIGIVVKRSEAGGLDEVQEDGATVVANPSAINVGHGLVATDEGDGVAGIAVDASELGIADTLHTDTAVSGAHEIDLADGTVHDLTLTGAATLSLAGGLTAPLVSQVTLYITPVGNTVIWPTIDWEGGEEPDLSGALVVVVLTSFDGWTTTRGFHHPQYLTRAEGDAAYAALIHSHGGGGGGGGGGEILISDTPSTPLVFADLIQNEAQNDLVYADPQGVSP